MWECDYSSVQYSRSIETVWSTGTRTQTILWVLDFLTSRPQAVRISNLSSIKQTVRLGTLRAVYYVLSSRLSRHTTVIASQNHTSVMKFTDDSAVTGLITGGDETAYRRDVVHLLAWCHQGEVERMTTFKFLSWSYNTTHLIRKSHHHLYYLRRLKKFGMSTCLTLVLVYIITLDVTSVVTLRLTVQFPTNL